jgi:hypothetical protein
MPLTTYTAGQVLTAASLNDNFTFAASNPPSGLELVSTTTIGTTVSSVTVTGAFSATYDNYFVIVSGGVASTNLNLNLTLGSTTANYYLWGIFGTPSAATVTGTNDNNGSNYGGAARGTTQGLYGSVIISNPFLTTRTVFDSRSVRPSAGGEMVMQLGFLNDATSYTAFTLTTNTGTVTGGTIKVYGYANS